MPVFKDLEDARAYFEGDRFAVENGLEIVADIPRSNDIIRYEDEGKTVVEGDPSLEVSKRFIQLASRLLDGEV